MKRNPLVAVAAVLLCGSILASDREAKSESNPVGFQELPFKSEKFGLAFNGDGTLLGVVDNSLPSQFQLTGKTLQVWTLKSTLQPEKLLYTCPLSGSYAPHITWVGKHLLFSLLEDKTEEEFQMELEKDSFSASKFIRSYVLSMPTSKLTRLDYSMSEYLLPYSSPGQVFVINSIQDQMSAIKSRRNRTGEQPPSLTAHLFDLTTNKEIKQLNLPMVSSGGEKTKHFLPLFFSEDGQYLVGSAATELGWTKKEVSNYDVKYLVSIKLANGDAQSLTSEEKPDSLYVSSNQPFGPGLPCAVEGGKFVACALNAFERNLNYRFQYYKPTGGLVKEVKVNDRDLKRAGLPASGEPITWTNAGDAVLQVGSSIWLFDIKNWKSVELAKDIVVDEVHGWAGNQSLLVRVRKVIGTKTADAEVRGKLTKVPYPVYSTEQYWGFLTIPEQNADATFEQK